MYIVYGKGDVLVRMFLGLDCLGYGLVGVLSGAWWGCFVPSLSLSSLWTFDIYMIYHNHGSNSKHHNVS